MIACPECGGFMGARANPMFRACEDCGKTMVVTDEARQALEQDPGLASVPAPIGLEVQESVTGAIAVPDYTDVMIGWRAWMVQEQPGFAPILLSMNAGGGANRRDHGYWEPRETMAAFCSRHPDKDRHPLPVLNCGCGLYSAKSRNHLLSMGYQAYDADSRPVVIGSVNLWGRIVEGTQGWRAEYGYPRELFVPFELWRLVEPLMEAYGVPVKLNNTLKKTRSLQEAS